MTTHGSTCWCHDCEELNLPLAIDCHGPSCDCGICKRLAIVANASCVATRSIVRMVLCGGSLVAIRVAA